MSFPVPSAEISVEQTIRNSRFICCLGRASDPQTARAAIDHIRRCHPRANHVCWAYIAGPPDSGPRAMSDDGEPRGTAGKPMLSVLEYSGFGEIWVGVIRYFGGIKLGTGGLVRAYSSSVTRALALVQPVQQEILRPGSIRIEYSLLTAVENIISVEQGRVVGRAYDRDVRLELLLPEGKFDSIDRKLADISGGRIKLDREKNPHN